MESEPASSSREIHGSVDTGHEHIKLGEGASFWSRAYERNAFVPGSEVNIHENGTGWRVMAPARYLFGYRIL